MSLTNWNSRFLGVSAGLVGCASAAVSAQTQDQLRAGYAFYKELRTEMKVKGIPTALDVLFNSVTAENILLITIINNASAGDELWHANPEPYIRKLVCAQPNLRDKLRQGLRYRVITLRHGNMSYKGDPFRGPVRGPCEAPGERG